MTIHKTLLAAGLAAATAIAVIPAQAAPLAGKAFATAEQASADDMIVQVQALTPEQLRARNARRAQTNALGVAVGVGALAVGAAAAAGAFQPGLPPPPRRIQDDRYYHYDEGLPPPPPRRRVVIEEEPVFVERRRRVVVEEPEVVYQRPRPRMSEAAAFCAQRFRSYDPRTGTYIGFDGIERSCP